MISKNTIVKIITISLIILVITSGIFYIVRKISKINSEKEIAILAASEQAGKDLGNDFEIITVNYDGKNDYYTVGCINSTKDCAIIYTVSRKKYNKWTVELLTKLESPNAEKLFRSKHSIIR